MGDLPGRVRELIEGLELLEDRQELTMALIDFADRFREVPEAVATRPFPESHRVQRCESEAYVWTEEQPGGGLKLHFAVENPQGISARALAAILDETLSGEPPEEILKVGADLVYRIFGREVSMGKGQGLMGMIELTRALARGHLVEREL